ncbi:hypothetical protein GGH12_005460 [Coemansia sp. RSA 1822]|nr:hypothetical protein LPJ76_005473 [Coemansia sp. RSA 638]KAJ2539324.1 hypothetical protein GGF49_005302 [Coemansia sp. RSA 1853]KAJ2559290.1 hypothetical protein GGH12_005460 [Coemansia sp. RSA 1822]
MNPFGARMPDPQACVVAGTVSNPPTARDQHHEQSPLPEHNAALKPHYIVETERTELPRHHPNAGIGGYTDIEHPSDIGGYYGISREAEIGNDHVDSGGYPIRRFLHDLCSKLKHHK